MRWWWSLSWRFGVKKSTPAKRWGFDAVRSDASPPGAHLQRVALAGFGRSFQAGQQGPKGSLLLLKRPHLLVGALAIEQLLVRALLHDAPSVQHDDAVGIPDGGQAVRDDERRVSSGDSIELGLDALLGFGIKRRG